MEENKGSAIISIIFWGNDTMKSILELLLLCDVNYQATKLLPSVQVNYPK